MCFCEYWFVDVICRFLTKKSHKTFFYHNLLLLFNPITPSLTSSLQAMVTLNKCINIIKDLTPEPVMAGFSTSVWCETLVNVAFLGSKCSLFYQHFLPSRKIRRHHMERMPGAVIMDACAHSRPDHLPALSLPALLGMNTLLLFTYVKQHHSHISWGYCMTSVPPFSYILKEMVECSLDFCSGFSLK